MSHTGNQESNQTDSLIERDRASRMLVTLMSPIAMIALAIIVGLGISALFMVPKIFGVSIGLGLGAMITTWIISKSYIVNDAVTAFVTVNPLTSLRNEGNALVSYGPGLHLCYWWEQRHQTNTVNLGEATETVTIVIQGPDGTFTVTYSIRIRPDITNLPNFLSGVAAVAADLSGIISSVIIDFLDGKTTSQALEAVKGLNKKLHDKFKHGSSEQSPDVSDFERRFGVVIDITIEGILPSKEVQETLNARTESAVIDEIVAKSFGYKSNDELQEAIRDKVVSGDEVNRRRTQTLALSGNLQGMDLKEHTFNLQIKGLENIDPKLAEAITAAAPVAARLLGSSGRGSSKPKGGSK